MNINDKQLRELFSNYENDELLENSDLLDNELTFDYDELKNTELNGMLLSAFRHDGRLKAAFTRPSHTLIVGATESGKTTGYISPSIQILSSLKNKSSMFITDPKGELFTTHYNKLVEEGYNVRVFNLRDPNSSDCWNPLTSIFLKYHQSQRPTLEYAEDVETVSTDDDGVYRYEGVIYNGEKSVYDAIQLKKDELRASVENEIVNFADNFIKQNFSKDPYWDNSSRELLLATIYLFLEDSLQKDSNININNFSFRNIVEFLSSSTLSEMASVFNKQPKTSRAYLMSSPVRTNAETTANCIIACANSHLAAYKNYAIMKLTGLCSFDMDELDSDVPIAVFLIIKDEERSNYDIATFFIQKVYERLVNLAEINGGRLKRTFYFILDEFGNLPEIPNLSNMITAGRSRGIWMILVVQSYAQIDNVYSREMREVLRDNTNMHIYYGSNDYETRVSFSTECGKKTIISPRSYLSGRGAELSSIDTEQVPLVTTTRLNLMNEGECYITRFRSRVLKAKIERSYQTHEYNTTPADIKKVMKNSFVYSDPKFVFNRKFITRTKPELDW